jgi:hypothetical protein
VAADARDAEALEPDLGDLVFDVSDQIVSEPIVGRRGLGRRRRRGERRGRRRYRRRRGRCRPGARAGRRPAPLEPARTPLERIGRQRHAPTALARVLRRPVDLAAGQPHVADRAQKRGVIRPAGPGAAERRRGRDLAPPAWTQVLAHQRGQGLVGPCLDEDPRAPVGRRLQGRGEPHRVAHLASPVLRRGDLVARPRAGHARHVRPLRRAQRDPAHRGDQLRRQRIHVGRVEGAADRQAETAHAVRGQLAGELVDGGDRPRDRAPVARVHGRERQPRRDAADQLVLRQPHRQHGARRHAGDQPPAHRRQVEPVLGREHAGPACSRVLAEAVPEDGVARDAPALPQGRQRLLDGEQARQRDVGPRRRRRLRRLEQPAAELQPELGAGQLGPSIDLAPEDRLGRVQLAGHAGAVRALPGEQERGAPCAARDPPSRPGAAQGRHQRRPVRRDDRLPPGELLPALVARERDVGRVELRPRLEVSGEIARRRVERRRGSRR